MPRSSWLLAFVAIAFAARLAFALGWWTDKPLTLDEREYLALGRNLAAGEGLVYDEDGREHFGRAPGYPAFLAAIFAAGGDLTAVRVAQSAIGAATVPVIAFLANAVAGPTAALVAAGIAAVHPLLVSLPAQMLTESLYSLLALGAALVFGWALARPALGTELAVGVLSGLATLVRPGALPWLGLVGLALLLRGRLAGAAAVGLGAALVVGPWAVHKSLEAGRLVLVASEGGVTFWTGNHPLAVGEGDLAMNPALRRANEELRAAHPGLGHDALEPVYYAEALAFVRERPLDWLVLEAKKLFHVFVPVGPSYSMRSPLHRAATLLTYLPILALALAGLPRVAAAGDAALPLALSALAVVAVSLVFMPQERFRLPVLDPVLVVCASVFLAGRLAASR